MVVREEAPGDWWTPSPPCQASSPGLQLLFRFFFSTFSLPMAAWSPVSCVGAGGGEFCEPSVSESLAFGDARSPPGAHGGAVPAQTHIVPGALSSCALGCMKPA